MLIKNSLHNLNPIVGGHFEFDFNDDVGGKTLLDLGVSTNLQNNWYVIYEIVDGNAFITVDSVAVPLADGSFGTPIEEGQPYVLWRAEMRRLRIIAATGLTPRFIGQKYYYQELT